MKLSKFVIITDTSNDTNNYIAFSTLTRAIVQLPIWLYNSIQNCENIIENFTDLEMLKSTGIVVDDNVDEERIYRFWSNRVTYDNSKLAITPIMTYGCNCTCKYCYEEGIRQGPDGVYMTKEMCERLVDWAKRYMILREPRLLDVCFHGGEPILRINEVVFLANAFRDFCEDRNIKYNFSIVTNGTLLTPGNTERLLNAGIDHALVTLDGPKEIHDERRCFITSEGTFDIIIKNIIQSADKLKISININVDRHNCESAYMLANTLVGKNLHKIIESVNVSLVEPSLVPLKHCITYDLPQHEYCKYNLMIYREFLKKGFKLGALLDRGFCTLSRDHQYIIDPRGDIYKCVTGVGDDNFKIGNIDDNFNILAIKVSQYLETNPCDNKKECIDCQYRPICRGGCRHESYVRFGDKNIGICMREYNKNWIPNVIKEFYGK